MHSPLLTLCPLSIVYFSYISTCLCVIDITRCVEKSNKASITTFQALFLLHLIEVFFYLCKFHKTNIAFVKSLFRYLKVFERKFKKYSPKNDRHLYLFLFQFLSEFFAFHIIRTFFNEF